LILRNQLNRKFAGHHAGVGVEIAQLLRKSINVIRFPRGDVPPATGGPDK
jgi:hypothetical protein